MNLRNLLKKSSFKNIAIKTNVSKSSIYSCLPHSFLTTTKMILMGEKLYDIIFKEKYENERRKYLQ